MNEGLGAILGTTLLVATSALALVGLPSIVLAHRLARRDFVGKSLVQALVALPLVLPPTAIGILLLRLFATDGPLGARALGFDPGLVLDWKGAALASAVMSAPLVVRTARVAFEEIDPIHESLARTLGFGPIETFFRFALPMAARGLAAALVLGFTRALGEYGATVTIAGSIPGETRTLASAIVTADQAGDRAESASLVLLAIVVGLIAVAGSEALASRRSRR